ncbi:MAG: OmpH family outer membrane protein [Candidatus Zixiibacteriota bacterium]
MRKYVTSIVALAVVGLLAVPTSLQAQVKIGTVDVQRVREESPQFKKAMAEIDDMVKEFEQQRDRLQADLERLAGDFQENESRGLTASSSRQRVELQEKSQEFQKFMEETFGTGGIIEANSEEKLAPLYQKLTLATKTVATAKGLDLVLDLEQVTPLYASDGLDVTTDVLAELAKLW